MLFHSCQLRVRYADVDRMGYLHHGNYASYFEVARTEMIRELGITYKELEDQGILLPVRELSIRYLEPILYDEEINVITEILKKPLVKFEFNCKIENVKGIVCAEAKVCLVFVDSKSRKPCKSPTKFNDLIQSFF